MTKFRIAILILSLCIVSCNSDKKATTPKNFDTSYKLGQEVYNSLCITCHLENGKGVPKAFPPLANSDFLKNNQEKSIKGLKFGMSEEIVVNGVTYNSNMAAQGLSNSEIADVMNYINNTWGNDYGTFLTIKEVSEITTR